MRLKEYLNETYYLLRNRKSIVCFLKMFLFDGRRNAYANFLTSLCIWLTLC